MQNSIPQTPSCPLRKVGANAIQIAAVLLVAALFTQVRFAATGIFSKIGLGEIAFAFLALGGIAVSFRQKKLPRISWLAAVPPVAILAANLLGETFSASIMDCIQSCVYFLLGTWLFSLWNERPVRRTIVHAIGLALFANIAVACVQTIRYGAFMTLAPRDVMELQFGFGHAVTGLFRSKIAFSCFVGGASLWLLPHWLQTCSCGCDDTSSPCRKCTIARAILLGLAVYLIPHAPIQLITLIGILVLCLVYKTKASPLYVGMTFIGMVVIFLPGNTLRQEAFKRSLSPLKGYDYAPDAARLFNQDTPWPSITATKPPLWNPEPSTQAHELKTCYYDAIAAFRLAAKNPFFGVGSNNYQKNIGLGYGLDETRGFAQLPKAAVNDIETDSQSGWGILAATLGIPACALCAMAFLIVICFTAATQNRADSMTAASAATLLSFLMIVMVFTNPLTRGLAWFFPLAFAALNTLSTEQRRQRSALAIVALVLTFGLSLAYSLSSPLNLIPTANVKQRPPVPSVVETTKPATPAEKTPTTPTTPCPECVLTADEGSVLLCFDADKAMNVTAPMRYDSKQTDVFPKGILAIPDGAGVPPAGKTPDIQYGGCTFAFKLASPALLHLWFNVQWDGSCGNTIDIRLDNQPQIYTIGNDSLYHAWHWMQSPKTFQLDAGLHTITVMNREDGILLGQVFLTDDAEYIPDGVETP